MDELMKEDAMTNEIELRHLSSSQIGDESAEAAMLSESNSAPRPVTPPAPEDLQAVYDVPVKVQAILGRARMDIGELLRLKPGMVVELDRRVGEPVDIFVNNRLIARGEVVLIDNALGITLTEIVRQEGS
jgi:flagellar motor switch protein FliN/FliY